LIATPARALDVMHPSLSPDSEQIGNHGVHRTLRKKQLSRLVAAVLGNPACFFW
jgi:hypothetical protein